MPVEKRGILQRWAPRKRTTLKANLSSEEWMRKPNWVHITKNHMYPKKKDKGVFYSKDLKEIRELCRATLLNPDLEKMDKNYPDRRKLKRKFRHAVGEDGLMGCKCYFVTVIYDRMENEVVTAFPSLYWTLRRLRYSGTSIERSAKRLGKLVRYIEGSFYRKSRFNELAEKQLNCSLYRDMVNK